MENYYEIKISNFLLVFWIIIGVLFSICTIFLILIVPICYYFILKNCRYYYDNDKLIVKKGVFSKTQQIVPLYRIINIVANENIFKYGTIYIRDKEQTVLLKYVKSPKEEMIKLSEKWELAKMNNIRNEVI